MQAFISGFWREEFEDADALIHMVSCMLSTIIRQMHAVSDADSFFFVIHKCNVM